MKVFLYTLSDAITLIVPFFSRVFPRIQSFALLFAIYIPWFLQFCRKVTPKSVIYAPLPTEHLDLEFSQIPVPSLKFLLSVKSITVHLSSKARIMCLYVSQNQSSYKKIPHS